MPVTKQDTSLFFAEVVASSLTEFTGHCWVWDTMPAFGSLVVIADTPSIIGIVHHVETGSLDPTRFPFPYQKSEDELKKDHPQIFEFLKTTFTATVLGTLDTGPTLPPYPAKIHRFIQYCPEETLRTFMHKPQFLPLLCATHQPALTDELFLALINQLDALDLLTKERLEEYCHAFSLLTSSDYRRLKVLLSRLTLTKPLL